MSTTLLYHVYNIRGYRYRGMKYARVARLKCATGFGFASAVCGICQSTAAGTVEVCHWLCQCRSWHLSKHRGWPGFSEPGGRASQEVTFPVSSDHNPLMSRPRRTIVVGFIRLKRLPGFVRGFSEA